MPMNREGFEGNVENPDNPTTPASEPARSQPPSPQKKKRKVSRSHSISAQPSAHGGYPPPNVYTPSPNDHMMHGHQYDDHLHGSAMQGMHMNSPMGMPPGHHMMHPSGHMPHHMQAGMPPHMQHSIPPHPHSGHIGHPMHHPSNARFMRPPGPIPPQHIPPNSQPMHPQGMNAHMANPMPHGQMQSYSPVINMNNRPYPADQPMIFNVSNPNAPPIYPCGMCHKEVNDSDQAIQCEGGCNFWFHRHCTGLTEQAYQFLTKEIYAEWVCDACFMKNNIPLIKIRP